VIALLDVNVLVALFDSAHVHHDLAHDWFEDNRDEGWASCPLTENGLLRILGNPGRVDPPISLPELVALLKRFCDASRHQFWVNEVSFRDPRVFNMTGIRGHRQLTDVYLLGLAVTRRGRFVTLDEGVSLNAVVGARREHLEVIAPAE
jgi:toxin-antitoxin system PIN domain toxin